MKLDHTATALQIAATCLLGLMAGFFFAFAIDVAPAMRELDASSYVQTQQAINRVVRNAGFALAYFGAAIVPGMAALTLFLTGRRAAAMAWLAIALAYLGGVFLLTREINVPINNALATWNAASPPADWAAARDRWNEANFVRFVFAGLAFAGSVIALRLPSRHT